MKSKNAIMAAGAALAVLLSVCLFLCLKTEPCRITIYEVTDPARMNDRLLNHEQVTLVRHYRMSDGSWRTEDNSYLYRLEIAGKRNNEAQVTTFIYLSNRKEISFEEAWRASGLSSNMGDYFSPDEAKYIGFK